MASLFEASEEPCQLEGSFQLGSGDYTELQALGTSTPFSTKHQGHLELSLSPIGGNGARRLLQLQENDALDQSEQPSGLHLSVSYTSKQQSPRRQPR